MNFAVLKTVARRGQISYPNLHFSQNSRLFSFTNPILAPPNLHLPLGYFIKIQAISLGKFMATRPTSLHRSSNYLTNNNDLDSIGYLFRLPLLLYCMTLRYLYVRRLIIIIIRPHNNGDKTAGHVIFVRVPPIWRYGKAERFRILPMFSHTKFVR